MKILAWQTYLLRVGMIVGWSLTPKSNVTFNRMSREITTALAIIRLRRCTKITRRINQSKGITMKTLTITLLLATSVALAVSFVKPTALTIAPELQDNCYKPTNTNAYTHVYATGTDAQGNVTGYAALQGYDCGLAVHSGRGPGFRTVSACAAAVWQMDGAIVSVKPIGGLVWSSTADVCPQ
jgi:hypothetical protein